MTSSQHERLLASFHYDPETGVMIRRVRMGKFRAGTRSGSKNVGGYRNMKFEGKMEREHRVIWFYMTGAWPDFEIDHENRDGWDNKWKNLRPATRSGNNSNTSKRRKKISGLPLGVYRSRSGTFLVTIQANKKQHYVGCFRTIKDAVAARKEAAERLHGEFAA